MEPTLNVWELIRQGGMAMYPLVLCSIVTLAVIAERAWVLWRVVRPGRRLTAALLGRVTRRELDEARVIVCGGERGRIPGCSHRRRASALTTCCGDHRVS